MEKDLGEVDQAIELVKLKVAKIKAGCDDNAKKLEVIKDIELALGWLSKKIDRLRKSSV